MRFVRPGGPEAKKRSNQKALHLPVLFRVPMASGQSATLATMVSSQTVEWPTPQRLFDKLDGEFHFTVDVAANADNTKCERFYAVEDDGLSQDWDGEVVWCNPPYGPQLKHWVYKAATSECVTVMLVPARTDVLWFHDVVLNRAEIRFVKGRITFGDATTPAPFPCMLLVFRGRTA